MNNGEFYVLKYRDGYMAIDQHSGGYPYKTDNIYQAQRYSLQQALERLGGDADKIYKCVIQISELDTTSIDNAIRETALAKLTERERRALNL